MPVLHPLPASTHIRPLTPDPSPLTLTDTPPGTRLGEVRGACLRPCSHSSPSEGHANVTCSENLCQHRGLEPGSLGSSPASATRTLGDIASAPLGLGFLICAVWVATGVALGIEGRDATRCGEGVCGHGVWGVCCCSTIVPPTRPRAPHAVAPRPLLPAPSQKHRLPPTPASAPPCLQASPGKGGSERPAGSTRRLSPEHPPRSQTLPAARPQTGLLPGLRSHLGPAGSPGNTRLSPRGEDPLPLPHLPPPSEVMDRPRGGS